MLPQHQPILWLEDPAATSTRRTGGKAAALAAPRRPPADPARLRRRRRSRRARGRARLRASSAHARRPGRAARRRALLRRRRGRPQSSFAGQHETILGVRGARRAAERDRRLPRLRSTPSARCTTAARTGSPSPRAPLPVLVQLLVPADAAAVVFSVNPVAPRGGEVLVNAAFGLGESIVGGTVTPDEWALDARVARRRPAHDRRQAPHDRARARRQPRGRRTRPRCAGCRRSATSRRAPPPRSRSTLEDDLGFPVDLELAWTGDDLHLLQCRPITTLAQEAA